MSLTPSWRPICACLMNPCLFEKTEMKTRWRVTNNGSQELRRVAQVNKWIGRWVRSSFTIEWDLKRVKMTTKWIKPVAKRARLTGLMNRVQSREWATALWWRDTRWRRTNEQWTDIAHLNDTVDRGGRSHSIESDLFSNDDWIVVWHHLVSLVMVNCWTWTYSL